MKTCKLNGCNKPVKGRSDRKYCCDEHKSKNNNAKNKVLFEKLGKRFNNTKSTYKCLQSLYPQSKGIIPIDIETMYDNKFKSDIFYVVKEDDEDEDAKWICIEDYGYRQISKTEFLIDKKNNTNDSE